MSIPSGNASSAHARFPLDTLLAFTPYARPDNLTPASCAIAGDALLLPAAGEADAQRHQELFPEEYNWQQPQQPPLLAGQGLMAQQQQGGGGGGGAVVAQCLVSKRSSAQGNMHTGCGAPHVAWIVK